MKKSILVLSVLLFLFILTCVYQKSEVLYAKHNDNHANVLTTIAPISHHNAKEEITGIKVQKKEIISTKMQTEVLNKPIVVKQKSLPMVVPDKQNDIEKIDTLIRTLKEREVALKNRDEFELHIQQLIKQALEDRSAVIAHMNKEELRLLELQKELIKTRDVAYDKIGQTNTPTSGE